MPGLGAGHRAQSGGTVPAELRAGRSKARLPPVALGVRGGPSPPEKVIPPFPAVSRLPSIRDPGCKVGREAGAGLPWADPGEDPGRGTGRGGREELLVTHIP